MYRYIYDPEKCFSEKYTCKPVSLDFPRVPIKNSNDLKTAIQQITVSACEKGKAALALSGGIDSAILARFVPEGTTAYTFRCVVPGIQVIDETDNARLWAELNYLNHEIIDITWEDIITAADICMMHKGAPIHSIESQIYIAASKAVSEGKNKLIFGENADIIYGGMNGLLAKDWLFGEFVDRYTYVMPYKALHNSKMPLEPFQMYENNGHIDGYDFINQYFRQEALGTYINACQTAGITFIGPYSQTYLDIPIDYSKIRSGNTKYIIRELFQELYPGIHIPGKIPMPRPMDEWLAEWSGPTRPEFLPNCTENMTGDQKWMIWCLERFLNNISV